MLLAFGNVGNLILFFTLHPDALVFECIEWTPNVMDELRQYIYGPL
ncbi:hypothetical protein [Gordoniibacillus kamchatkensis]|nr:hypothetical protein [Paenibacillus sp. VKM B-2647]